MKYHDSKGALAPGSARLHQSRRERPNTGSAIAGLFATEPEPDHPVLRTFQWSLSLKQGLQYN
jgi:hypothetical protein